MTVMREAIDTTTLGWIKPELDETLRLARQEIEEFAEDPTDGSRMRFCAGHLHQVQGTLRMIELYAPAMVAEEMENLALALQQGAVGDRDEACAALMRGVVLLPDYLERLQSGHRDIPIVLLPLLNELRASRGEPGLSESVLFAPNLDRPLPENLPAPTPSTAAPALRATEVRAKATPHLAALRDALAAWPEDGVPSNAAQIAVAVDGLLSDIDSEAVRRMLWVASSVAGALRDGALPPNRALRQAFASVEREARQVVDDNGFAAPSAEQAAEPTRQLLYHVAHSHDHHPALDGLRETFELDAQLPSESELEHARGSLSGRNRALLDTVSAAIKEDLLRVKDALDLHLRTGQTSVGDLQPQIDALTRVGDTLGMMGLGVARNVVMQQRDAMREIVFGQRPADEGALLDVAGALLYVDASLDDQVARLGLPEDKADEDLLAGESRKVLEFVVREAIANFGDARQSFVAFVETSWDHAELVEVPRLLDEVSGALRMIELPVPADYLHGIRRYTEDELIGRKRVPNGKQLDTLADALASVEYYLEALREQRPNRDDILEIARHSLEALRYWPLPADKGAPKQAAADDVIELPDNIRFDMVEPFAGTVTPTSGAVTFSEKLDAGEKLIKPTQESGFVNAGGSHAPVATTLAGVAAGGFEHSDDIDDEIREVFLEELNEEIVNLGELLAIWREVPEDFERLRPIRRVFHTLKGSGRLVGAKTLGEFSWKIENLLNRVLDGTRSPSAAVIDLVERTHQTLPQLHDALRDEAPITADLEGLKDHADLLATGEEAMYAPIPKGTKVEDLIGVDLSALEAAPGMSAEVAADDVSEIEAFEIEEIVEETAPEAVPLEASAPIAIAGVPASVDSVLLEILSSEVGGHALTIEQWLTAAHAAPTPANDGLQRAIHTLNGAFAMTEVPVITEITAPTEAYVKRLLAAGTPASAEGLSAMSSVAKAIRGTLVGLQSPQPHVPHFDGLAERMLALRDSLPDARSPLLADIALDDANLDETSQVGEIEFSGDELAALDLSAYTGIPTPVAPVPMDVEPVTAEPTSHIIFSFDDTGSATAPTHILPIELTSDEAAMYALEELTPVEITDPANLHAMPLATETAEHADAGRLDVATFEMESFEVAPFDAASSFEAESLEASALETQLLEAERLQTEAREAEQLAAERVESERLAAERAAAERLEAEQADAARLESERLETDRLAAEQAEVARLEAARLEAERQAEEEREYARLEAEYAETARREQEQREAQAQREAAAREAERLAIEQREAQARAAQEAAAAAAFAQQQAGAAERLAAEQRETEQRAREQAETQTALTELNERLAGSDADPDAPLDLRGLDPELVEIFVEEGGDLLDHSDGLLAQLRSAPGEREPLIGLQRDLHTLKGGARMAGIMAMGELGHVMESLLEAVVEHRVELGRNGLPLLERGFDRLHAMVTRVGNHRAIGMPDALIAEFDARARGETVAELLAEREAEAIVQAEAEAAAPHPELKPLSQPIDLGVTDEEEIGVRAPQEQVRIRADLLDKLVNFAGEVAIYRARLEQQLGAFRGAIAEMEQTNIRMRDQLRRLDIETEAQIIARYQREHETADATFDPLELDRFSTLQQLSRALAESAADQTSLQVTLDDLTRQYETLLLQQSRVSSELQEGLMRTRMVPFDGLLPRLRRVVRQASGELGKQVTLKLEGTQGELDRNVLERMTAPLEHMLRNGVAHGLETPEQRKKAHKPEEGTIRIALRREGSEVVLEVGDDGAGLNRAAIRKRAEERGLIRSDANLANADLDALILEPGFSTADEVSRLAGRGVGMDVVASEVRQLGGTLDIASEPGKGVTFTLRLPQTLAVTQAVFVRIGDTSFAVPIASVRGVGRIARELLNQADATYRYGGEDYPVHDLGALIGHATAKAEGQMQMPVLLIRSGDLRAAVCIDQVIGNREIVVKPVGPQVASIPGIFGATVMGDGRVVVILDIAPLVRRQALLPRDVEAAPAPAPARPVPLVMVVDDSVTMRKVTGRVLERHNFEVLAAKDGIDALEKMTDRVPDLMLLDIEMPRMDGYELASAMKADPRLRGISIIMITSRTGEKHRQRAFEIGVDRYLGKPYQEHELLRNVFELLAQERAND